MCHKYGTIPFFAYGSRKLVRYRLPFIVRRTRQERKAPQGAFSQSRQQRFDICPPNGQSGRLRRGGSVCGLPVTRDEQAHTLLELQFQYIANGSSSDFLALRRSSVSEVIENALRDPSSSYLGHKSPRVTTFPRLRQSPEGPAEFCPLYEPLKAIRPEHRAAPRQERNLKQSARRSRCSTHCFPLDRVPYSLC